VNERAAQVDREYFAKTGASGSYYMYYLHNLQFILYARAMQGRLGESRKALAQIQEALKPLAQSMPEMADVFGVLVAMSQLRMCRLAVARPKSANPLVQAMWRYSRALSLCAKIRLHEAGVEQQEFEKLRKTLDRNMAWDTNNLGDVMDLASAVLEARMETSPRLAVPKWRRAIGIQDALAYGEPPAWYYPVRESLGAALRQRGSGRGGVSRGIAQKPEERADAVWIN
jgi:hypothetical protein